MMVKVITTCPYCRDQRLMANIKVGDVNRCLHCGNFICFAPDQPGGLRKLTQDEAHEAARRQRESPR
jgi:hypothetical protein